MPEDKKLAPVLSETTLAYSIAKDGFMPGWVPGFRVVTVTVDKSGKAKVEASKQKYVLEEARAMVDDLINDGMGM